METLDQSGTGFQLTYRLGITCMTSILIVRLFNVREYLYSSLQIMLHPFERPIHFNIVQQENYYQPLLLLLEI
jgi:hypothetical protein